MSNNSSYKRMFVLNEDEYKEFKRFKATQIPTPTSTTTAKCQKCGREYPNGNILALHLKSHVDGFKCNICGKVFETKENLNRHLKNHAPQVQPTENSVLENSLPTSIPKAHIKSITPPRRHHHHNPPH